MIEYIDTVKNITTQMLKGFFKGWKKPHTPEEHLEILKKSNHIILAIDSDNSKVIGFITAPADTVQSAFIAPLEVLPEYRNQRIGTALVSQMLEKLKGIPAIDLTCDSSLQKFYSKLGMMPSVGIIIRDY